jgi:hypothetical protein
MNAISTGEYRASDWDCVDAFPLFFFIMSFHMAALARVGRGGLPKTNNTLLKFKLERCVEF